MFTDAMSRMSVVKKPWTSIFLFTKSNMSSSFSISSRHFIFYPELIGRGLIAHGWVCLGFGGQCGKYTGEGADENALRLASYDLDELALCVAPDLLILYWLDDPNLSRFVGYVKPGMHSKILIIHSI